MPTDQAQERFQFQDLNEAKALAWSHCADAVRFLASVIVDEEADTDWRIAAAGELLSFALKGAS